MALGIIARFFGRDRAQSVADRAEYVWHDDPNHDAFYKFLNLGGQPEDRSASWGAVGNRVKTSFDTVGQVKNGSGHLS
jgi:hypothetical protein